MEWTIDTLMIDSILSNQVKNTYILRHNFRKNIKKFSIIFFFYSLLENNCNMQESIFYFATIFLLLTIGVIKFYIISITLFFCD